MIDSTIFDSVFKVVSVDVYTTYLSRWNDNMSRRIRQTINVNSAIALILKLVSSRVRSLLIDCEHQISAICEICNTVD